MDYQTPRFLLLSTMRSGSTFLRRSIKELDEYFDDHNYTEDKRSTDAVFGLCRTHLGTKYIQKGFCEFLENVVVPRAEKIIINERRDLRMIALSDVIRRKRKEVDFEEIKKFDRWDKVNERYQRIVAHWVAWRNWITEICPAEKCLFTTWEELNKDATTVVKYVSEFLKYPLKSSAVWESTDYSVIPNLEKHLDALGSIYGYR